MVIVNMVVDMEYKGRIPENASLQEDMYQALEHARGVTVGMLARYVKDGRTIGDTYTPTDIAEMKRDFVDTLEYAAHELGSAKGVDSDTLLGLAKKGDEGDWSNIEFLKDFDEEVKTYLPGRTAEKDIITGKNKKP